MAARAERPGTGDVPLWLTFLANVIVVCVVIAFFTSFFAIVLPLHLISCGGRIKSVAKWRNRTLSLISALIFIVTEKFVAKPLQFHVGYEVWVCTILYVQFSTTLISVAE